MSPTQKPRKTELIGLAKDGRMMLWDTGMVQPINRFETTDNGRYIVGGHYVIDWHGHAITIHCGNFTDSKLAVLFMCSGATDFISMERSTVEPLLLGKVIRDPKVQAQILEKLKKLSATLQARSDQPHRQRGRIA